MLEQRGAVAEPIGLLAPVVIQREAENRHLVLAADAAERQADIGRGLDFVPVERPGVCGRR